MKEMGRNLFIFVILTFMVSVDLSNASFVWEFRKLISVTIKDTTATVTQPQLTPLPAPAPGKGNLTNPQVTNNSSNVNPNGSNDNNKTVSANPPTEKQIDIGKDHEGKKKGDNTTNSQLDANGSCKMSPTWCRQNTLLACIQTSEIGSKELDVVVQNEGEGTLNVNLTIPTSPDNILKAFEIPDRQTKKINVSATLGKSTKIVLNAGNGDCVLQLDPPKSKADFFHLLSFYSKQVTPIYGAYLVFLVALIFGGTWACCKLRKRRSDGGVAYQELEMGLPESATAVDVVDTAEGWDEHWDDDWDEDKAVKSPGGMHVGSISANGLTSRSSKKDGWEDDWDD